MLSSSDENETHDVKLIDFGAAVALEEGEQVVSGGRVGTWTYWAPEQADKDRPYDSAVDMWSLGVLLYIMLTGRHPFERAGIDSEEVLERILNAEYSLAGPEWRGVSPRAAELVAQLMHPDPKQRLHAQETGTSAELDGATGLCRLHPHEPAWRNEQRDVQVV